ncbi:hypothetical protein D2181_24525 [Escherichia coli]|nr:hypothetical protein D2188_03820 [Escherichia coli]RJF42923.1 hypothetical protein D2181_24525 [Escherichia coli]
MMNPVPWLQMTNMISYQGLVRTFPSQDRAKGGKKPPFYRKCISPLFYYFCLSVIDKVRLLLLRQLFTS